MLRRLCYAGLGPWVLDVLENSSLPLLASEQSHPPPHHHHPTPTHAHNREHHTPALHLMGSRSDTTILSQGITARRRGASMCPLRP